MKEQWKILSSSIVYQKKWLRVREEACQLPDGRILNPYISLDVPGFCNIFIVTENEEVVLVKQYRHAAGIVSIELPGGMVDPGEEPLQAAVREMREETGYASDDVKLLYAVSPNPPLEKNTAWFYLAKNARPTHAIELDAFEDIELLHVSKQEFINMLLKYEFTHGVQTGAMYAAAIELGWLAVK